MKAIWSDMFYDIKECNDTEDTASIRVGLMIGESLRDIEDAINKLEPKKALELIKEMKDTY